MIVSILGALIEPSPSPTDVSIDGTPLGSPGFLGFVFTFAVAVAAVFLFRSLTKQLRVVDRRAKAQGLDDEDAPRAGTGPIDAGGPDSAADADDEPGSRPKP